jgi:hypothetical protein
MAEPAKSSNAVVPFPDKRVRRRDHELAFLPAALEIVETPASPIGRAIGATIIMVFVLASAWACLGTVDIVATASGKIKVRSPMSTRDPVAINVYGVPNDQAGCITAGGATCQRLTLDNAAIVGEQVGRGIVLGVTGNNIVARNWNGRKPITRSGTAIGASPTRAIIKNRHQRS